MFIIAFYHVSPVVQHDFSLEDLWLQCNSMLEIHLNSELYMSYTTDLKDYFILNTNKNVNFPQHV